MSSQVIFKISSRFFHLFMYPLIYSNLFVSHISHIVYSYSYLLKVLLSTFTIPEMESERKIILDFGLHLPLDLIWIEFDLNLFNIVLSFNKPF